MQWWVSSEYRLLNISNLATQTEVSRLVLRPGVSKTRAMCCCVRWNSLKVEWPIASGCFALLVGCECLVCFFSESAELYHKIPSMCKDKDSVDAPRFISPAKLLTLGSVARLFLTLEHYRRFIYSDLCHFLQVMHKKSCKPSASIQRCTTNKQPPASALMQC